MATDYEVTQSIAENFESSSGENNASSTEASLGGTTPTETESNAKPNNEAHVEPVPSEKAKLDNPVTAGVSEDQLPVDEAELVVPLAEARAVSTAKSVTVLISDAGKEDVNTSAKENKSDGTLLDHKKKFLILKHFRGNNFMLPFALCQTWKGMEELIKFTYGKDETAKNQIEEGKYELLTEEGAIIFRHCWDMLVEPEWKITILLNSQERSGDVAVSDSNTDHEEENFETVYATKVNYTIAYYLETWRNSFKYLYSTSYNEPVIMERSGDKARELPVLDEKKTVNVQEGSSNERKEGASKRGPKLDTDDVVSKTSLRINSPFLLNALRSIIKYSSTAPSGEVTDELNEGEFLHPYADLFYHKQELSLYKNETTGPRANHTPEYNAECDRHIDVLLDYLDQEPIIQLKSLENKWAKKVPTTTFAGLWLLMKPGSDVYVEENGQINAYVVDSVSGGINYLSLEGKWVISAQSYSIRVWNLSYDGKFIGRASKLIHVPIFDKEKDILSLPLFPASFQDKVDCGTRRNELIERGKKVLRFAKGPAFLEYTGSGLKPGWKKYNRARVVVEHESQPWEENEFGSMYEWHLGKERTDLGERARGPHCECSRCTDPAKEKYLSVTFSDYDSIDPKKTADLSEHQYMLCMSHMFGFILKDRTYDILDVSGLVDPKIVENAIDRLVMRPEENKDTIKAIAKSYADSSQAELFSADFIHGKGEGQIFLLHGPPGTGKTLTAESVAEYTKRPLLSITAADLGHEPIELETNLVRFFNYARNWDAIVLLDEADVYLERRSVNDLRRNSIVSIFLRAMDYFQGILFLTTNRVGHFDEAFMSRIHVSIGYERLDQKAREQIWDNLFYKLKEDHKNGGPEIRYEYDAKQYVKKNEEVLKLQWNGREIRNAFQTAVALAVFDSKIFKEKGVCDEEAIPEVKEKHLKQVVTMSTAFKKYITATHEGIEDADLAYKLGIRYDKVGKESA